MRLYYIAYLTVYYFKMHSYSKLCKTFNLRNFNPYISFFRYITWIDRDPETIARQESLKKKDKMAKDDEERMAEFIRSQVRNF